MEIESSNLNWYLSLKRNQILDHTTSALLTFQSSDQSKLRALRQLSSFLKLTNASLDFVQFNTVFKLLVRFQVLNRENNIFPPEITRCASLLSRSLPLDDLTEQVMSLLEKDSSVDSLISLSTTLNLFENLTRENCSVVNNLTKILQTTLSTFVKLETRFYDNPFQLTRNAFLILFNFTSRKIKLEFDDFYLKMICKVLVMLKTSFSKNEIFTNQEFESLISNFAERMNLTGEQFLQSTVGLFTNDFVVSKEYEKWNEFSSTRKQFMGLVLNFPQIALLNLHSVLIIIEYCTNVENDPQTRFDALEALEAITHFESNQSHSENIRGCTKLILVNIVKKSLTWKVGKPNLKIRKAAMVCGVKFLRNGLFDELETSLIFSQLIPLIKSCLGDDHDAELRLMSLDFCQLIFWRLRTVLMHNDVLDIYASILERFDDAQDEIRVKAAEVFGTLYECNFCEFSKSLIEYILKVFFVHFDDSNELLQIQILKSLVSMAGKIGNSTLLETAKTYMEKFRHPDYCLKLIRILEEKS